MLNPNGIVWGRCGSRSLDQTYRRRPGGSDGDRSVDALTRETKEERRDYVGLMVWFALAPLGSFSMGDAQHAASVITEQQVR